MIAVTERAIDFAVKLQSVLGTIKDLNNGDLPIMAKRNLLNVREILNDCMKQIDEIFGVEEL